MQLSQTVNSQVSLGFGERGKKRRQVQHNQDSDQFNSKVQALMKVSTTILTLQAKAQAGQVKADQVLELTGVAEAVEVKVMPTREIILINR